MVDTELLLLYLVGKCKPLELQKISNNNYNEKDYEILSNFLKKFQRIFITPYILAEISNLTKTKLKKYFKKIILECESTLKSFEEKQIGKEKILNKKEAQWLGFPDVSIIISSEIEDLLIISEDGDMIRECEKLDVPVLDFSSLRATYGE